MNGGKKNQRKWSEVVGSGRKRLHTRPTERVFTHKNTSQSMYTCIIWSSRRLLPTTSDYFRLLPLCFAWFHSVTLCFTHVSHTLLVSHPVPLASTQIQPCPPSSNMVPFTSTYLRLLPSCFTHFPNTLPRFYSGPPTPTQFRPRPSISPWFLSLPPICSRSRLA